MAQMVKSLPIMQVTHVLFLDQEVGHRDGNGSIYTHLKQSWHKYLKYCWHTPFWKRSPFDLRPNYRKGTQPQPSAENCIKDLQSMACTSEQDPDSPTVSPSHQEASTSLLPLSIRGCILSPCLFNLYAEYIMWNARQMKHKLESGLTEEN